jgi:hypothetical protein
MTNQEKLDYLIAIMHSDKFDTLFDKKTGITNVGGKENYQKLVNDYIEDLCSFGDVDAYQDVLDFNDDTGVHVMVEDFSLFCWGLGLEFEGSSRFFMDTDSAGWMREYIDEVAEEESNSIDLEYRDDFDKAFDLALNKLKNDQPELNFDLIMKYKESFF